MNGGRDRLRRWIAARSPGLDPAVIDDRTPLVESRYLRSRDLPELLLLLEELTGGPLDPASLRPGTFADLDTICRTFLEQR